MSKNALLDLLSPVKTGRAGSPNGPGQSGRHGEAPLPSDGRKEAVLPVMRAPIEPGAAPAGSSRLQFVASTGGVDRYGEVIEPTGWVLDSFRQNPVFLNSHRYRDVGDTLGKVVACAVRDVVLRGGDEPLPALVIEVDFAALVNPLAKLAYDLYAGGYLNAVSVGFIPLEWRDMEGKNGIYRVYLRQELLEVSAVGVPANPDCLVLNRA
jgi:HK97 family phage prohead protease